MKAGVPPNPRKLDVARLAELGQALEGSTALADFSRLLEDEAGDAPRPPVAWQAQFAQRPVKGGAPELSLRLQAQATVRRTCQRCLQPVALALEVDRRFLFAPNEEQAEAWDAEAEEDVLVLSRSLDLMALVEDELLLTLPIVPRHEACPEPLNPALSPVSSAAQDPQTTESAPDLSPKEEKRDNPFAVLAQLKARR